MQRFASVIGVKKEHLEEYTYHHKNPWPQITKTIAKCNIKNYSIYHHNGLLFSYFEYVGNDFDADMKEMAKCEETQKWWKIMNPCQEPLPSRKEGEFWAAMDEVFHQD